MKDLREKYLKAMQDQHAALEAADKAEQRASAAEIKLREEQVRPGVQGTRPSWGKVAELCTKKGAFSPASWHAPCRTCRTQCAALVLLPGMLPAQQLCGGAPRTHTQLVSPLCALRQPTSTRSCVLPRRPPQQDKVSAAEDALVAARKEAAEQVEVARKSREKVDSDLRTVQQQLNDVNARLLELAASGPAQTHPVTGEACSLRAS